VRPVQAAIFGAAILLFAFSAPIVAGTITISGAITQSTPDGTGPAVNNTSLNNIADTQTYTLTLVFPGAIGGSGNFTMTSGTFSVAAAPASEAAFSSLLLTITPSGVTDQFSLLGCLSTGSGCSFGNQLSASFSIPAAQLNGNNVAATGLDQPHPLDLLEDDGTTDIQGSITNYSYTGPAASAPEPAACWMIGSGLVAMALRHQWSKRPTRATRV
jgi:hypothetical protein